MRSVLRSALALGLAGCGGQTVKPHEPITDPGQVFFDLQLNYGAVNLSTAPGYETFQLAATPLNAMLEPMTGMPTPTFRSTDTTRVKVSPTGLLTALRTTTGTGIRVIAELTTSDNVKHVDTAFVTVVATNPPPALATFTIDPVPPDSAIWAIGGALGELFVFFWTSSTFPPTPNLKNYVKASTAGGAAIPSTTWAIEFFSLDSNIVSVNRRTGALQLLAVGHVRMVARTVAYGVVKADTTAFTVTPPVYRLIKIGESGAPFLGAAGVIRQAGYVYWANFSKKPVGVVFDGPGPVNIAPTDTACVVALSGGTFGPGLASPNACNVDFSMDSTGANVYRIRRFMVPGTYTYRDTLSGATGKVIVMDSTVWQ